MSKKITVWLGKKKHPQYTHKCCVFGIVMLPEKHIISKSTPGQFYYYPIIGHFELDYDMALKHVIHIYGIKEDVI